MLFDPFAAFDSFAARPVGRVGSFVPPIDLTVSETDLVLTMDVPGLSADDLEIQFEEGFLTVRGQRTRPQLGENTTWAHAERSWGAFERRVKLPTDVDAEAVTASLDNGVLSLIIPKPERLQRRTIEIARSGARHDLAAA